MSRFKHNLYSTATVLLISLALHGCQNRLQVTDENKDTTKPGVSMSSSKRTTEATPPSRKRSAEALAYDTEEKKESPTDLVRSAASAASTTTQGTTAMITRESQKSAMMTSSQERVEIAAAKPNGLSTTDADKEAGEESADLKRWFEEFVEAVDDEAVLYQGESSRAIPALVQEGKKKGYLTESNKLVINEVGWEPDCTPLHYAAAKGNTQAVDALLKESEVQVDARTKESGTTPLQFAANGGHLESVKLLIDTYKKQGKIRSIDERDNQNTSTLQYTASGTQEDMNREVAELLVEAGADPLQMDGNISLMDMAAVVGNSAMIEYCMGKVFNHESEKQVILSAIRQAKRKGHMHIVVTLQGRYKELTKS